MKTRSLICAALLVCTACAARAHHAAEHAGHAVHAKAKPAAATPVMDPKAMEEMMMKLAAPGPNHERFKKLEGHRDVVAKWTINPTRGTSQPRIVTNWAFSD